MTYGKFLSELLYLMQFAQAQLRPENLYQCPDSFRLSNSVLNAMWYNKYGYYSKTEELRAHVDNAVLLIWGLFHHEGEYSNLMREYYAALSEVWNLSKHTWATYELDDAWAKVHRIQRRFKEAGYHIDCGIKVWEHLYNMKV